VAGDLSAAGFNVVGTADDGPSAVNRTLATRPDVLVLDLNLPGMRGDEVCAAIIRAAIPTRVLILSASGELHDVLEAVKVGATGYLLKSAGREEFLDAVRATARGKASFTPGLAGLVLGEFRRLAAEPDLKDRREVPELTARETEVLKLVATGSVLQADRGASVHLPPHRAEPRAEHLEQAPAAQPRRACPLRHSEGTRQRRRPVGHLRLAILM